MSRTADSPGFGDVNAAINGGTGPGGTTHVGVAPDGETVNIPSGSADWGTNQLFITKAIVLAGAGMTSTTITSAYAGTSLANYGTIRWFPTISPSYAWGPRGFRFNYSGGNTAFYFNGASTGTPSPVLGISANLRMTDMHVKATAGTNGVLLRWTEVIGCVDHCILDTGADGYQWGLVYHETWGGKLNSHGTYEMVVPWGTVQFLYFEDCWMVWGGQDAHDGARYVARHCRFTNGARPLNHGTESHSHGCRAMEVYQNWTSGVVGSWAEHRSGSLLCHDNIIQGASATYSCQNHRNSFRKNAGSVRGENPTYATQTVADTGRINHTGGYSSTTTVIDVDGFSGKVVTGYIFQIDAENPVNTLHSVVSQLDTGGTSADTIQITFTPGLVSSVLDNAIISVLVPPTDRHTPLEDESLPASDSNLPTNGNVSPDEYTGFATSAMAPNTATFTDTFANWTPHEWKTVDDSNYANNAGFVYQLVNTDDIQISTSIILDNTNNQITVSTNAGATTVPIAFAVNDKYAIRKTYAGQDQPGMGPIKVISPGSAWLANTNDLTTVCSTGNVNSPTGSKAVGWPNQNRDPNYNWNNYNTTGGFPSGTLLHMTTNIGTIVGGRDIIEDVKPAPGYGTTGTGGVIFETYSPGYPQISSPTAAQRQVGAKGITGVSDATILYGFSIADVYGYPYPHVLAGGPVNNKVIFLTGTGLVFGNIIIGQSPTATVTCTNQGNDTLTVASVASNNGKFVLSSTAGFTVGAGLSHDITVTYTPTTETTDNCTITFDSDADSGTETIAASGTGVVEQGGGGGGKGKGHKKGALSRR